MQTNMNHSTDRPSYYINPLRVSFQTKAYSAKIQTIFKRYRVLFIAVSATLAVIILLWGLYLAYDSYLTRKGYIPVCRMNTNIKANMILFK